MRWIRPSLRYWPILSVFTLALIAACGGGDDESTFRLAPTQPPASSAAVTTATPAAPPAATEAVSAKYAWDFQLVDEGTKPALALTSTDVPHIQYMLEAQNGWVKEAALDGGAWGITTVANGYFYGPGDIDIGPDDVPWISYHDHQDSGFDPNKGDAIAAAFRNGAWDVAAVRSDGHDGWDNRVFVDAQGNPHISAVDPREFGGGGVKYYGFNGTDWKIEDIGGPSISYAGGTSLAVDAQGTPHVVYFNDSGNELHYAVKTAGSWAITTVDSGDAGLYPDIVIGADGTPHLSYIEEARNGGLTLKYAVLQDGAWQVTTLDTTNDLVIDKNLGSKGARNLTSIVLDADGNPIISYSDERVMKVAYSDGAEWRTETIAIAEGDPFAQLTSLRVAADGTLHLAYALVTGTRPLEGEIWYAKGTLQSP